MRCELIHYRCHLAITPFDPPQPMEPLAGGCVIKVEDVTVGQVGILVMQPVTFGGRQIAGVTKNLQPFWCDFPQGGCMSPDDVKFAKYNADDRAHRGQLPEPRNKDEVGQRAQKSIKQDQGIAGQNGVMQKTTIFAMVYNAVKLAKYMLGDMIQKSGNKIAQQQQQKTGNDAIRNV
jgi:hypothetical protein